MEVATRSMTSRALNLLGLNQTDFIVRLATKIENRSAQLLIARSATQVERHHVSRPMRVLADVTLVRLPPLWDSD